MEIGALPGLLHRAVDYDLWATRSWLSVVDRLPCSSQAMSVLVHMADAHVCWLTRIGVKVPLAEVEDLDSHFASYAALWKSALEDVPPDHIFHWNDNDVFYQLAFSDIVFHILNHGTYHRGHLRGLAHAAGFEDFDDTEYDWFASP